MFFIFNDLLNDRLQVEDIYCVIVQMREGDQDCTILVFWKGETSILNPSKVGCRLFGLTNTGK